MAQRPDGDRPAAGLNAAVQSGRRSYLAWQQGLAVAVCGGALMALEILAFLLNARSFGGAWRETTAVIAVFLLAMSIGYFLGGWIADRWPRARTLPLAVAAAGIAVLTVPLIETAIADAVFHSPLPLALHALLASLLVYFLPVALLSTVSPITIRLSTDTAQRSGGSAGRVMALSAAGSLAGTLLAGYYLIDALGVSEAIRLLGLAVLGVALLLLGVRSAPVGAVLAAWLLAWPGLLPAQPGYHHVRFAEQSNYHWVQVSDSDGLRTLKLNGRVQSTMRLDNPLAGHLDYVDGLLRAAARVPAPRRALVLGLGGGSTTRQLLARYPELVVDAVELDPMVLEVAQRLFEIRAGERLRLHTMDARLFLRRAETAYDLIVVDAYGANRYGLSIPRHLVTREFFELVSERLRPGGVLAYNVASNSDCHDSAMRRAVIRTVSTHLDSMLLWEARDTVNTVLIAHRPGDQLPPPDGELLPAVIDASAPLLSDEHAPVEALMRAD